jgi:aminopeptidase-like protein
MNSISTQMYKWMSDLFPICRSITGEGVRDTLKYFRNILPDLVIHEVPSGTQAFDWTVPDEWQIRDAYIEDESGQRVIDFQKNNLHVVGYSEPVDEWMNLEQLNEFLYSLSEQPMAIPYITSYYERRWGFCLSHEQRLSLKKGNYHVVIDSEIQAGALSYGEIIIPGKSNKEVFLSTYVCHPSMANNELSGPVVTTALVQWLSSLKSLRYTYRIIYIPETIGSILYLSKHFDHLKKNVIAGFNITCVGDERCYSYLPSRNGHTLSDKVSLHVLKHIDSNFIRYKWTDRGSDERQYCAPGIDLPMATIMRSKYAEYPEYHSSLDNLDLVTAKGLEGGFKAIQSAISVIEKNKVYKATVLCEPQLGKRGLYPTLSTKHTRKQVETMMNILTYCDGTINLLEIAELIGEPFLELVPIINKLKEFELVTEYD